MGLPSFSVNEALTLIPFRELQPHVSLSATLFLIKDGSRYLPHLTISTHDAGTIRTQSFLPFWEAGTREAFTGFTPKSFGVT